MKKSIYILIFALISVYSFAQQATEIDPKFVKLPRYANLSAITTAITAPTQGMMVYNVGTGSKLENIHAIGIVEYISYGTLSYINTYRILKS